MLWPTLAYVSRAPGQTTCGGAGPDGEEGASLGDPTGVALDQIEIPRLLAGDKRAWDDFVAAAAPLIHAVARRVLQAHGHADAADVLDTAQDVFVRLAANDYRLLAGFDPARA